MTEAAIRHRLVTRGKALFDAPPLLVEFTREPGANVLLNDLERHPHAFVLGCVMDQQIRAERAWLIPYRIGQKLVQKGLDGFSMDVLRALSRDDVQHLMSQPQPLHRFADRMGEHFRSAAPNFRSVWG
jgi:hypothetical protein